MSQAYDGQRYWFEGAGPDDEPALDSTERRLYRYPMTDEEAASEERRQRLFEQEGQAPAMSVDRHGVWRRLRWKLATLEQRAPAGWSVNRGIPART